MALWSASEPPSKRMGLGTLEGYHVFLRVVRLSTLGVHLVHEQGRPDARLLRTRVAKATSFHLLLIRLYWSLALNQAHSPKVVGREFLDRGLNAIRNEGSKFAQSS